jgi:alpha-L-fucosidase
VGHKKIDVFPAVTTQRVRLNLLSTVGSAGVREFQLYDGRRGEQKSSATK